MPAKKDPNTLTIDDVSVVKLHEVEKKTLDETAEIMNVSRETVKRIKKKPAYRDFVLNAIEAEEYNATTYAKQLIALTNAVRKIRETEHPDNTTRMKAIIKMGDILGVDAPREYDLQHSIAGTSDEELDSELAEAERKLKLEAGRPEPAVGTSDTGKV